MKATTKRNRKPKRLTHAELNAMPLHKLLAIGLRDLRTHERTKGCVVQMGVWLWQRGGKCFACLAGSVLRHSFGMKKMSSPITPKWAMALDSLRMGSVGGALLELYRLPLWHLERPIAPYGGKFWRDMRKLQRDLRKAGL